MIFLFKKRISRELSNKASDLLIKLVDAPYEPFSEEFIKLKAEFEGVINRLSKISPPYKDLSDAYRRIYEIHKRY